MKRKHSSLISQALVAFAVLSGAAVGLMMVPMMARIDGYTWKEVVEQALRPEWRWQNVFATTFFTVVYAAIFRYFVRAFTMGQLEEEVFGRDH